jgi:hypothetical protein
MITTGADLARGALREIGQLDLVQPGDEQIADACLAGSKMLDLWRTDKLTIRGDTRAVYPLVSGDGSYTIGPDGDFDQEYPESIDEWAIILDTTDTPQQEEPRGRVLDFEAWSRVVLKDQDGVPNFLFFDRSYTDGLGNLALSPIPDRANLGLVLYQHVPSIVTIVEATTYDLPPGYVQAIEKNLACTIAHRYGIVVSRDLPDLKTEADEALGAIRRANIQPKEAKRRPEFGSIGTRPGRVRLRSGT